jgi:signal transduction histidine kinase
MLETISLRTSKNVSPHTQDDCSQGHVERIGAIKDESDRLREARSDTKRFMAFLFHEIRVPLSVISLGIPSLRDQIAEEDMHEQGLEAVLEQEHAEETTDLMGRSMDVVQRVLGDVLDLLHGSTDEKGQLITRVDGFIVISEHRVSGLRPDVRKRRRIVVT